MDVEFLTSDRPAVREESWMEMLSYKSLDTIYFFESDEEDTFIVLADGSRRRISVRLDQLERLLPTGSFLRCGWGFIVNLNRIKEFWSVDKSVVVMDNGEVIPLPKTYRYPLRERMARRLIA
jgi:DNA-binding LytR/AlgR family response regulator